MIHRLRQGSETLIFSYARLIDDKPCMPSPLVRDYPPLEIHPLTTQAKTSQRLSRIESYTLALQDTESITGGTTLLTNQAKCPFRAFAAHRLHAKQTLSSSDGLNAMERGQLIHRVLELVWTVLKNQHNLLYEDEATLAHLVQQSILDALISFIDHHPLSFPPLLQSIEIKRLTRLVEECFEWEKTRPDFNIEALEHATTIELEGLTFHIKVDRIDTTSSGKKWIIDYKSRLPATKPWREERPEAPQLLLYALLDKHINGLAFVELNKGHVSSSGFCEDKTHVKGMTTLNDDEEWAHHQAKWHTQLSSLVREFKAGHCSPVPTKKSTCNTCEFQNLCRVDMQSASVDMEE
jgi:probable DNA repair protein